MKMPRTRDRLRAIGPGPDNQVDRKKHSTLVSGTRCCTRAGEGRGDGTGGREGCGGGQFPFPDTQTRCNVERNFCNCFANWTAAIRNELISSDCGAILRTDCARALSTFSPLIVPSLWKWGTKLFPYSVSICRVRCKRVGYYGRENLHLFKIFSDDELRQCSHS